MKHRIWFCCGELQEFKLSAWQLQHAKWYINTIHNRKVADIIKPIMKCMIVLISTYGNVSCTIEYSTILVFDINWTTFFANFWSHSIHLFWRSNLSSFGSEPCHVNKSMAAINLYSSPGPNRKTWNSVCMQPDPAYRKKGH